MIRLLLYFIAVGILGGLAAWLANHPGDVVIHWFDYEAQTSVSLLIVGTLMLALVAYGAVRALRFVLEGPAALARIRRERRRAQRLHTLVRGFAAAAIGDGEGARRALKLIGGGDDLAGLKPLLAAQVAEIARDDAGAEAAYRELLKHKDGELLGLRGLYETALRQGDREAALAFATRAFEARPRSRWLTEQLFRAQIRQGAWDLARKTAAGARRSGNLKGDQARRREGVLAAAEALTAQGAGDEEKAFERAQKALALAPGLAAMAALVAKRQAAQGQSWAAAGTIEAAWRRNPHPDLARIYRTLKPGESDKERAHRLMGLAEFNPGHVESRLLVASEALQIGEIKRARRALMPALEAPSARVLMLMSEIALKSGEGDAAAQAYRDSAVSAPRDAQWTCCECARERLDWVPVCDVCGAFDSYAWGTQGVLAGAAATLAPPASLEWQADLADAAAVPAASPAQPSPTRPETAPSPPASRPSAPAQTSAAQDEIYVPQRQPDDPGTDGTKAAAESFYLA